MKASELAALLNAFIAEVGDLPVILCGDEAFKKIEHSDIEINTGDRRENACGLDGIFLII